MSIVSFAASASVTSTNSQAVQGVIYNISGGFTASSIGITVTPSAATVTALPATWSNGGTVTTATVAGNWQYSFTVTMNANALPSTTYTVTVQWNTGSGYVAMGSPLTFATSSAINAGDSMTFVLDTGVDTFNAPASIVITVA